MTVLKQNTRDDVERALDALNFLEPPLDREEWVKLLMAAHDAGVSEDDARAWSERGENFDADDFRSTWRSIKPGKITVRTLFATAFTAGWNAPTQRTSLTAAEIAARNAERVQRREQEANARAEREAAAAERAKAMWGRAQPANDNHPYLLKKGVKAHNLKVGRWETFDPAAGKMRIISEQALLIPIRNSSKQIVSLQAIFEPDNNVLGRDRDYLPGGKKSGGYFTIGMPLTVDGRKTIIVAEGYSTAASIFESTGHAVAVAFDKGNLQAIATLMRERYPDADIVVFSDRDAEVLSESGGTKAALKAALAAKARIVVPEWCGVDGRDANDIHTSGFTWGGETFPGKDIIDACVRYATPYRSPAFVELLKQCGIESGDLADTLSAAQEMQGDGERGIGEGAAQTQAGTMADAGSVEQVVLSAGFTGQEAPVEPATDDETCELVEAELDDAPTEILLEQGELPRIVDFAEQALVARASHIFVRGGRIVRPIKVVTSVTGGKKADITQVKAISKHALAEDLTKVATWVKADGRRREGDQLVRVNCPLNVAETLLARDQWSLRPLTAIIHGPTLRADGSVLEAAGYDQTTGLLLEPNAAFMPIPQTPSRDDALAALARLKEIVSEFPFVSESDKSVWFAGLLTAAIRRSLPTAPMFAFTAPTAGTGKSYMADLIATIVTGEPAPALSQGRSEEETEKRLTGVLLAGHTIVNLDNCTLPVDGDFLCQALTQPIVEVRKMGGHDVARVPGSATMLATGNSLVIAGDMTRRALVCNLDAGVERPELREFSFNPLEVARRGRARYLVDALTILRAYHVAGSPDQAKPLGSFEIWSDRVRSALIWLGMADPCATMERTRKSDPKLSSLREVLHGLYKVFGERQVRVREIITEATAPVANLHQQSPKEYVHPDLREALLSVAGDGGAVNSKKLGKWMSANQGRPVEGLRLVDVGNDRDGVKRWMVLSNEPPI